MTSEQIQRIAVIGAGLMGHGIAQEFALAGFLVRLQDQGDGPLARAMENIRANLERLSFLGRVEPHRIEPAIGRITPTLDLDAAVSGAELVIEAIFEDLAAKHQLLRSLERLCPAETIFASNTSSFMPSRLAEVLAHPERLVIAHYFNPPYLIPLVEVVPGPKTSQVTIATMVELLEKVNKKPVVLGKEATGFVANRLQFVLFREALSIVAQGIAEPEAVDSVVKYGFGRRLAAAGPLEVFDLAGLDTILAVASQILPAIAGAGPADEPVPELLREKVDRGELGVKSGRGFHDWTPEAAEELRGRLTRALLRAESSLG
jgi:3-hydroxybutyryl-CoA dehydrogenase